MRTRALVILAVATAVLVAGCGDDTQDGGGATDERQVPIADHPGADAYATHCASCHGADLRGTGEGPSHLSWVYEPNHHPDWSFELAIRDGARAHHWSFGDMPPITEIDDEEILQVIDYVRAVQDQEGFEPYPPS
jgi:mono/diheme cytochrome c family protein